MARVFITEEEAIEWGLLKAPKKKVFNLPKMVNNVTIRVVAGVIVLCIALLLSVASTGKFASLIAGS